MGQSIETRVRVISVEYRFLHPTMTYVEHEQYPESHVESPLSLEAYEALKDSKPGEIVEVVWDFDTETPGYVYPIVSARRITGSLEERVERLEALFKAHGIDAAGQDSGESS